MLKIQLKIIYILILLMFIIFISSINAQTNVYVVTATGKVHVLDISFLKVLGDGNGFGITGRGMDFDGFRTIYGSTMSMNNWIIFDVLDLKAKKSIVEDEYSILGVIFNSIKKKLYIAAENDKKEYGALIYSIDYNENNEPILDKIQKIGFIKNDFIWSVERQITSNGEFVYSIGYDENEKLVIKKTDTQNFISINFSLPESIDKINNLILLQDNNKLYINIDILNQGIKEFHELVMNANNGNIIKDLIVESNYSVLSFNGKNLYLVKVDKDNNVTLIKINTDDFNVENISLGNSLNVSTRPIAISPDDSTLIIGNEGTLKTKGYVTIVDLVTKKIRGQVELSTYPVAIYFK